MGPKSTDKRGKEFYKSVDNDNIVILNNNEPTHINITNGLMSNIDLSLSALAQRLKWNVYKNITSSDHFLIIIKYLSQTNDSTTGERWNLKNPNWSLYSELLEEEINNIKDVETVDINTLINTFTNAIIQTANQPPITGSPKYPGGTRK